MANFPTNLSRQCTIAGRGAYQAEDAVIRVQPEAGPVVTRQRTTSPQRIFNLYYSCMSTTDVSTMSTFEAGDAAYGAGEFTWTHPATSATYTCVLETPIEYIPNPDHPSVWDLRITLRGR